MKCIQNLNGLSIIFYCSHSLHMQRTKRIQTMASVGLAQTCPNKTRLYIFQIKYKTVKYINHGVHECNKISGPHCTRVLEAQLDSCNWAFTFINLSTPQSKFMWCLYSSIKCMLSNFRKFLLAWLMEIIWT